MTRSVIAEAAVGDVRSARGAGRSRAALFATSARELSRDESLLLYGSARSGTAGEPGDGGAAARARFSSEAISSRIFSSERRISAIRASARCDLLGDLRLGEAVEKAELQDLALPCVEALKPGASTARSAATSLDAPRADRL